MSSKSWTSKRGIVSLKPFEEIMGRLEACYMKDGLLTIHLSSGTLEYDSDSVEAEICKSALTGREGRLVSILHTAIPDQPLRLLVEERKESTDATRHTASGEDNEVSPPNTTQLALDEITWNSEWKLLRADTNLSD